LLPKTLCDSEIAKKIQLQEGKARYTITFGLACYFRQKLLGLLSTARHIVLGFDESLNKVARKQQIDVAMRFWNEAVNEVDVRYLDSVFLGHTRAAELLKGLKLLLGEIICVKLVS